MSTLKFNTKEMEAASGAGFSTATELADSLVRSTGMPFRTAHRIVGRIAASGKRPNMTDLDKIALEIAGFRPSERGFCEEMLDLALDPRSNVALRSNTGGPAPSVCKLMIKRRSEQISRISERLAKRRKQVDTALSKIKESSVSMC
jgi:argininosuccinate lyase